jgi:hypothetical protein
MLARVTACTIALLAGGGAAADVTLSVVDATPTARHDGTLPGIGETIFSADIFVQVTGGDSWRGGAVVRGLAGPPPTLAAGVQIYHLRDPNTDTPIFHVPGLGTDAQEFATFASVPIGQSETRRFRGPSGLFIAPGFFGDVPIMEPNQIDFSYWEDVPGELSSGYTLRLTIDASRSSLAGMPTYITTNGPAAAGHHLLAQFLVTQFTQDATASANLEFFAVPEPGTFLFALVCGGVIAVARRAQSHEHEPL